MKPSTRRTVPALLSVLLCAAHAQTAAPPPGTVVVNGARGRAGDPHAIDAAKDRILNGKSASSCAFMDPYRRANDPVTLAYRNDFGLDVPLSDDVVRLSDLAPDGDVSNIVDSSGIDKNGGMPAPLAGPKTRGCTVADIRFAAGRSHIARNDKTLALGFEAYDNGNYARALQLFETAWNKIGYDEAALMLARQHLYGLGTPKDGAAAVAWLEKVDNKPYAPAERLRFDPAEPDAMTPRIEAAFMMARMYERGIGVARDPARARTWYDKAAGYGFVPALDILGEHALAGTDGPRDPVRGISQLKEAADAGYPAAQFHLARAYYDGDAVPRDLATARAYFEAAARAGVPAAMFAAGRMLDLGEGVKADPARAIVYYKDAALKGDRDARFALGTYFYSGEVVGKNLATARQWFGAAARQGQPDALFNLGVMTAAGEGGAKDPAMACVLFTLAQQAGHDGAAAALKALAPTLTPDERKRADAVLHPRVASAK
ncbi:sel1 repeat family protein [Massilia pinisoli]|uniref:Sel1 repeat family protein n=1 Tax=Massilia pinisoli TaxID=1772194 RepID=A0ABT1ZT84_9BURK|nr:tetratricopeptide repeat protein [Massilia pinisoli]MCS0583130.1 sel1 repeat family protein [Massilia pinisoli]